MHQYGARDVERLLRLPRSTIRSLVSAGFVSPARGPRKSYLFSFQDLIVLRTAQALAQAKIPPRRITRSLRELRRHLPEAMPLSGLAIGAVGDRVVVSEGASRWQAESGQYLLAFDGDPADGSLNVVERNDAGAAVSAEDWFERGCRLEGRDSAAAREAYCTKPAASPMQSASIARRSRPAAAIRCCSTTSAFCWKTWAAGARRWKRTKGRCTAIRASRTVITISRSCARLSASRGTPSGTWRSIEGWSSREGEQAQVQRKE